MNLYKYLLRHINFDLDTKFIRNFYEIQKVKSIYNVDLDIASDFLGAKRENIIENLVKNYAVGEDYIVKIGGIKKKDLGGSEKKKYFMKSECFKLIALRSRAQNGERVRKYYIKLEELVAQYKNEIISAYKFSRKTNKNNEKKYLELSGLYILKQKIQKDLKLVNVYRFGRTRNLKNRLSNYNSGLANNIELVYFYKTKQHKKIEKCVLDNIKNKRIRIKKDYFLCSINFIKKEIKKCCDKQNEILKRGIYSKVNYIERELIKDVSWEYTTNSKYINLNAEIEIYCPNSFSQWGGLIFTYKNYYVYNKLKYIKL